MNKSPREMGDKNQSVTTFVKVGPKDLNKTGGFFFRFVFNFNADLLLKKENEFAKIYLGFLLRKAKLLT
jgi:hypothetical protein